MKSATDEVAPKLVTLTGGSLLTRNAIFNLIGQGAPTLVALITIPYLVHELGTDRYGVLTLAWMFVGYFSLFDMGLGRALTQVISERLGTDLEVGVPALAWTMLILMTAFGVLGALVVGALSPWLVRSVLKIPASLQIETLYAFYLLAMSVPIAISTSGLTGILSALQRFDILNAIRIPMGIFSLVGPLIIMPFSKSLFHITAVLLASLIISWSIYLAMCLRIMPALRSGFSMQYDMIKPLLRFGGWMTITNVIGPLMVYLDRFAIGAVASMAAVAYYAIPYQLVTKLWIVPGAIVGVLFPAFSASYKQDRQRTALLFARGTKYVFLVLYPITLILVAFAQEGLSFWLGAKIAQKSAPVLQWLSVGVLINSMAYMPFALIQGAGRPDLTAKLHMLELPIYLLVLWWLLQFYGIEGAAVAWVIRVSFDAGLLFLLANRILLPNTKFLRRTLLAMAVVSFSLATVLIVEEFAIKVGVVALALLGFALITWLRFLDDDERFALCFMFKPIYR